MTLLNKGYDINAGDETGNTSLIHAIQFDHFEMVKLLVEHGADVHKSNKHGSSPLYWTITKDKK